MYCLQALRQVGPQHEVIAGAAVVQTRHRRPHYLRVSLQLTGNSASVTFLALAAVAVVAAEGGVEVILLGLDQNLAVIQNIFHFGGEGVDTQLEMREKGFLLLALVMEELQELLVGGEVGGVLGTVLGQQLQNSVRARLLI